MRDEARDAGFVGGLIGLFFGFCFHVFIVLSLNMKTTWVFEQQAVDAGAAKYKCDEKTGKTEFIWVKPEGEKK